MISVAIVGGAGRMGQTIARAVHDADDLSLTALVDVTTPQESFGAITTASLEDLDATTIDVVIDFSTLEVARDTIVWCLRHQRHAVIGTTGFDADELEQIRTAVRGNVGIVVAANFAIGAVLLQRFAAMAAPFFTRVELIEYHHDNKVDAPSGTALETARRIDESRREAGVVTPPEPTTRETVTGSRGATLSGDISVHAVRLPGLTAHQEVLFGREGEGLTLRHDAYDRSSFAAGVVHAVRQVGSHPGVTMGLDSLL
jgi:4-hydroxy-tetrahydrodipicolinate reductase